MATEASRGSAPARSVATHAEKLRDAGELTIPRARARSTTAALRVLVIDVGGSHVKILSTEQTTPTKFASGPKLTAASMTSRVLRLTDGWAYDVVSIGYPGRVLQGRPLAEPHNLGCGWVGFDFQVAFKRPIRLVNDAAMQALGGYLGGKMLFLGLGTGLGSALVTDGLVEPMELGHLPYRKRTFEDYIGSRGLDRFGNAKWRRYVDDVIARLVAAIGPEDVLIGGGNARKLKTLPPGCRRGDNADAFMGGFRLWNPAPFGDLAHAPPIELCRAAR